MAKFFNDLDVTSEVDCDKKLEKLAMEDEEIGILSFK